MVEPVQIPQVGAPDPELRTSPLLLRDDTEGVSLDDELESAGCYFNDMRYPLGQYVRCGEELYRCEERGVWVRKDETAP